MSWIDKQKAINNRKTFIYALTINTSQPKQTSESIYRFRFNKIQNDISSQYNFYACALTVSTKLNAYKQKSYPAMCTKGPLVNEACAFIY